MVVSRKIRFGALIKNSMETKEITKTIYIANDGKEFLTKEDCEKHERFVEEILSRIKYFCIRCNPDLTETGNFQHKIYMHRRTGPAVQPQEGRGARRGD